MQNNTDRVVPLSSLSGYKVADGEPDIRGWDVVASDGNRLGRVDDLLVDTTANKVRYVDVEADAGRHVCVPIGYATLDRGGNRVTVDRLGADQFGTLPSHDRGTVSRDYEMQLGRAMDTDFETRVGGGRDLYEHDNFRGNDVRLVLSEEELAVGTRQVAAGEVEVGKRVETQHVTENVQLRHDEVDIERRPITDGMVAAGQAQIGEQDIRIPLHSEEAVVEKRVVPKEEIVVRTREVVENETVEADLRTERAEIHREGAVERTLHDDDLNNRR